MTPSSRVLVLAIAACVLSPGICAAEQADSDRIGRLQAWMAAVERHRPGEIDASLVEVRSWTGAHLQTVRTDVAALVALVRNPSAGVSGYSARERDRLRVLAHTAAARGAKRLVRRGVLLHTDIALFAPPQAPAAGQGPALRQQSVQMADGRAVGHRDVVGHFALARSMLDLDDDGPQRERRPPAGPFVNRWYRATASVMLNQGHMWMRHFQLALDLFPGDPVLLFLAGAFHEELAGPRIQLAARRSAMPPPAFEPGARSNVVAPRLAVGSERRELTAAERYFRRATEADPSHVEAGIRLGRVLALLGRYPDAMADLERAASQTGDRLLRYYAALFLADAAEGAGDLSRARAAYQTAADLYPSAQSPRLGLSHVALQAGERGGPEAGSSDVLAQPADGRRQDPWVAYHRAAGRHSAALLAELYAMAEAPPAPDEP